MLQNKHVTLNAIRKYQNINILPLKNLFQEQIMYNFIQFKIEYEVNITICYYLH